MATYGAPTPTGGRWNARGGPWRAAGRRRDAEHRRDDPERRREPFPGFRGLMLGPGFIMRGSYGAPTGQDRPPWWNEGDPWPPRGGWRGSHWWRNMFGGPLGSGLRGTTDRFANYLREQSKARNAPEEGVEQALGGPYDALARHLGYLSLGESRHDDGPWWSRDRDTPRWWR